MLSTASDRTTEPFLERIIVTPELAAKLLERNTDNRAIRDFHVKKLSRDIADGKWLEDCQPIRIAHSGRVLDGQHRLWAVVEAAKPVWMVIARNVPEEAYLVMDSGLARTWADNANGDNLLSSTLGIVHFWKQGSLAKLNNAALRPTNQEKSALITAYPEIEQSRCWAARLSKAKVLNGAFSIFFHFAFSKIDQHLAEIFFTGLWDGANLDASSGVYWLRKRLMEDRKIDRLVKMALIIKAWNSHRDHLPVRNLRWVDNEKFPEIR